MIDVNKLPSAMSLFDSFDFDYSDAHLLISNREYYKMKFNILAKGEQ